LAYHHLVLADPASDPRIPLLRIAAAQLAPQLGDVTRNRAATVAAIDEAADLGARLIVLPELCTTGYAFHDAGELRPHAETAQGPTLRAWATLARRRDLVVVGGFAELDEQGDLRNSAAVVDAHGVRAVYRKAHLWDREGLIFRAGDAPPPVVDTAVGRIGVAVCYDLSFPEVTRGLALDGADVVAVPMNSPLEDVVATPAPIEVVLAMAAAASNRVFVAQADRAGDERGIGWAQATVLVGVTGTVLAAAAPGPGIVIADVDVLAARDKAWGPRNDVLRDRRPELYHRSTTTTEG
jgi:predicted amidohydrolase